MRWSLRTLNDGICHSMDEQGGFGDGSSLSDDNGGAGEFGTDGYQEPGTEQDLDNPAGPEVVNPGGQRQSEHVPYDRFASVNTELQTLNQMAQAAGYNSAAEYLQSIQSGGGYGQPYEEQGGEPDLSRQVAGLTEIVAQQMFDTTFAQLSPQFPLVEKADVRRALRAGDATNVFQAMQTLQQQEQAKQEKWAAQHTRKLQQRSQAGAEGAGGGLTSGGYDFENMPSADFQRHKEKILRQR